MYFVFAIYYHETRATASENSRLVHYKLYNSRISWSMRILHESDNKDPCNTNTLLSKWNFLVNFGNVKVKHLTLLWCVRFVYPARIRKNKFSIIESYCLLIILYLYFLFSIVGNLFLSSWKKWNNWNTLLSILLI